ncbi:ThuA domain-containing protein [Ferruginibacter albus]|uniref:ThuA domain-containing protein n=1 Tax=Ferruginibacter albus TaxID=2875540 RepID=UPI001CC44819|nr:ThuA domain-containing protein [Ferruginibacter albus]UAY50860.1 ThuA domain-containing protein [Ferruginibacter albus]
MNKLLSIIVIVCVCLFTSFSVNKHLCRVLVFSKTAGFHHESIAAGITAIQELGKQNAFIVDTTTNASFFNKESLSKYAAVIFLSTTGELFNDTQRTAFKQYIRSGGGFVGIHAAADAEYNWTWYSKLVGASFLSHPQQQAATLIVKNKTHPATKYLPLAWIRKDEWYNFKNIDSAINVLITIDEKTYTGGVNGDFHPMAWYHDYEGGRSFYTALGHTIESYTDPLFLKHLLGGIQYAIGKNCK